MERTGEPAELACSREALQRGQLEQAKSHLSTHSLWKQWWHSGKTLTLSPSSNTPRHIQHSDSTPTGLFPRLPTPTDDDDEWCKVIGKDLIMVGWRPWDPRGGA